MFYRYDQDRGDRFAGSRISNAHPSQYKRSWDYNPDRGIALTVLVEADTAEEANAKAEAIGIDFAPEDISVWGFDLVTKQWGTPPAMLHRWVKVTDDEHGFESEAEALGDSYEYVLFNPWEVDGDDYPWVFVHYANGQICTWEAHVLWRSEYDSRPVE